MQQLSLFFAGLNFLAFLRPEKALAKSPIRNMTIGKLDLPPGSVLIAQSNPCSPNGSVYNFWCVGPGNQAAIICKGGSWTTIYEFEPNCC